MGALSIVRFRAAIKEPEELVYLFLIIAAVVYFDWFSPWYYGRQAKVVVTKVFHSKIVEYISKELQKRDWIHDKEKDQKDITELFSKCKSKICLYRE